MEIFESAYIENSIKKEDAAKKFRFTKFFSIKFTKQ